MPARTGQPRAAMGPNVCKLLPGRKMAALIRQPVSKTTDRPRSLLVSVAPDRCARGNQYKYVTPNDAGSPSVLVMLVVTDAASKYRRAVKGEFETPTTVPHPAKQTFLRHRQRPVRSSGPLRDRSLGDSLAKRAVHEPERGDRQSAHEGARLRRPLLLLRPAGSTRSSAVASPSTC